jgi:hypothetical protein
MSSSISWLIWFGAGQWELTSDEFDEARDQQGGGLAVN